MKWEQAYIYIYIYMCVCVRNSKDLLRAFYYKGWKKNNDLKQCKMHTIPYNCLIVSRGNIGYKRYVWLSSKDLKWEQANIYIYIYILSSTDRLFRSIRTLQCG